MIPKYLYSNSKFKIQNSKLRPLTDFSRQPILFQNLSIIVTRPKRSNDFSLCRPPEYLYSISKFKIQNSKFRPLTDFSRQPILFQILSIKVTQPKRSGNFSLCRPPQFLYSNSKIRRRSCLMLTVCLSF